jgi:lipid-binding SYLF domain-containing protein
MAIQRTFLLTISLLLTCGALAQEEAGGPTARQAEIDANAGATLEKLFEAEPRAREMFDRAAGYAVFTATQAGGFFVTGGGGTGVAVDKTSGRRTYMRMGMGGVGLGIGARRYDLVILFESDPYLDRFIQGGWDASATAQAAAGREGVAFTSSFVDGVAFYQITDRGLMAQADISGTRFWVANRLN